jgi:hypothetical protein
MQLTMLTEKTLSVKITWIYIPYSHVRSLFLIQNVADEDLARLRDNILDLSYWVPYLYFSMNL